MPQTPSKKSAMAVGAFALAIAVISFWPRDPYAEAKEAVLTHLSDPGGATFGRINAKTGADGTGYYCGEVNLRNHMAGYGGTAIFFVIVGRDGPSFVGVDAIGDSIGAALKSCRQNGLI